MHLHLFSTMVYYQIVYYMTLYSQKEMFCEFYFNNYIALIRFNKMCENAPPEINF